jgi:predicted transcriptional regulator
MLLVSIHPKYVELILSGDKKVELRRRAPRVNGGSALIYATSPRMELIATFQIASVVRAPLGQLWESVRDIAGVTRTEFETYFAGLELGIAIGIADVEKLRAPVKLNEIRASLGKFHPPQGFRYLSSDQVARLQVLRPMQAA